MFIAVELFEENVYTNNIIILLCMIISCIIIYSTQQNSVLTFTMKTT